MGSPFVTLWSQPQREFERRQLTLGRRLDHTAGNTLDSIEPGDRVYVVTVSGGQLFLLGRLAVEETTDQAGAERRFGNAVYEASRHLIGTGSPLLLDQVVPRRVAVQLQRETGGHLIRETNPYRATVFPVRSTGRLTEHSAQLLDDLIDGATVVEPEERGAFTEGGPKVVTHERVERSPQVRTRALSIHGFDCQVCGFSFESKYGELGIGYAEVHHLQPLSRGQGPVTVDPEIDVAVVCANCHRMLHREDPPMGIEELRKTL